jgi:spermidine synthase
VGQLRSVAVLWVALAVFTASGFSGLIYESIWSHYLKLFLGHAAYAQTLVLAIFMGGMAAGAWLASRFSARLRNLLLGYAVVEALIGVASLGYHEAFVAATALAFDRAIPAIGPAPAIEAFKWGVASLLILPQSVLLGMTFPLMAGGLLRLLPERSGYTLALLYFTNSLGGAAGVLASGFYFIPLVGLPGTLAAAAVVNLAVAAAVGLLPAVARPAAEQVAGRAAQAPVPAPANRARLLLAVAALTGLSSFMYEVGWIRMLSLVLGSSTHAFELMLAAFILGLAFGGLWVRRRIDAAESTERLLGIVQLAMGVAAVATLPVYGWTFDAMQFAMASVAKTGDGYLVFNAVSQALALAVMFPAAFCAGMTLPLITASLLRRGAGERAIGQVYAANTAGAIAGVALAVHVGFPYLGLKGLIVAAAGIDVALGLWLLAGEGSAPRRRLAWAGGGGAAALVSLAAVALHFNPAHLASGVFRTGTLESADRLEVLQHIDGKTATVSVVRRGDVLALRTNGKTDGAIGTAGGAAHDDEAMMTLLGALPQVLAPDARLAANIGFGTGISSHVLLASQALEGLDTVEIEPAMVRAAAHFRPLNARALDDSRSRLHYEDAKTYFASRQAQYDVILSEPSNPWVSGVAGLFSTEFYREVRRYLRDDGLFFQWVQIYEMTPALLATVLLAVGENFPDYEVWLPNESDLIIVAAKTGRVPPADARALDNPRLRAELARLGIGNMDDLLVHRVAGKEALAPYFAAFGAQPNSDFFPVLDAEAPRARFLGERAGELVLLLQAGLPLLELFDSRARLPDPAMLTPAARPWIRRGALARQAGALDAYFRSGDEQALAPLSPALAGEAALVRAALVSCRRIAPDHALVEALSSIAFLVNQHLPRRDREAFWRRLGSPRCQATASARAWLKLHAAVGSAAPQEMAAAAAAVLDRAGELSPRLIASALAARMAGLILTGRHALAQREFAARRTSVGSDETTRALFRFLVGRVLAGA